MKWNEKVNNYSTRSTSYIDSMEKVVQVVECFVFFRKWSATIEHSDQEPASSSPQRPD